MQIGVQGGGSGQKDCMAKPLVCGSSTNVQGQGKRGREGGYKLKCHPLGIGEP